MEDKEDLPAIANRPRRRSRPRPLVSGLVIEKAVIDRANRMIPLACKEVEDENDDEDDYDWGSGGRQLRPDIRLTHCHTKLTLRAWSACVASDRRRTWYAGL